jgi:hypothetical protein
MELPIQTSLNTCYYGAMMRSFHQAIEREDVTLLEALLIKYQTTVFKSLYYNLHYFDL